MLGAEARAHLLEDLPQILQFGKPSSHRIYFVAHERQLLSLELGDVHDLSGRYLVALAET